MVQQHVELLQFTDEVVRNGTVVSIAIDIWQSLEHLNTLCQVAPDLWSAPAPQA
jgi:hypothetical protein